MLRCAGWLVSFILGLLVGSAARMPGHYVAPAQEGLRARVERRLDAQRRVVEQRPTWEGRVELLRLLCELQDREVVIAFHQEAAPAAARRPTPEQIELWRLLVRTAQTPQQRRTCRRLWGRLTYRQLGERE